MIYIEAKAPCKLGVNWFEYAPTIGMVGLFLAVPTLIVLSSFYLHRRIP